MSEENKPWYEHEPRKIATDVNRDTSPQILLFKAIDRKAFAAANGNLEGWQSGMNEIYAQLPARVKEAIEARGGEYTVDMSYWKASVINGIKLVDDPHTPLLTNKKGEIDYVRDCLCHSYEVVFDEETGDTISVKRVAVKGGVRWVSPIWVSEPYKTDYTKLNHIIHEEMELGGLTWKHDKRDIVLPGTDYRPQKAKKPQPSPMF